METSLAWQLCQIQPRGVYLERAVEKGKCYRGKVLSLDAQSSYSGQSRGLLVCRQSSIDG
jgi:hypothetical protein